VTPLTLRALVAAATIALVAAACGGDDDGGGGDVAAGTGAGASETASDPPASGGTLVIGMTASNIPGLDTIMFQSEGGEGGRFVGVQLWDGLTRFDLTQGETTPEVIPGLAESWDVSDDATTWTFHLRAGVTFHDGTPFDADAAIYNFDRMINEESPLYVPELNSVGGILLTGIASATKVDDMTIEIVTDGPNSFLLEQLALVPFGSPTAIEAAGDAFAEHPVGTGPFMFESVSRGQELVLVRNPDYYRGAPLLDRLILRPIPEVTARMAALRSGEVDWIEVPAPDEVPALEAEGYQVLTNYYSHVWPWVFDVTEPPWDDVRVRQAVNYAIDRDTMSEALLNGTGSPALQYVPPSDLGYDPANDVYSYDPDRARELLAEAGYADGFSTSVSFPTSGSGNMVPIPMNEAIQRDLAEVGIDVELEPIEWGAMLGDFFAGAIPGDADSLNISLGFVLPSLWGVWFSCDSTINVGHYCNPDADALIAEAAAVIDPAARGEIFAELGALLAEDAPWLLVVNDLNPRVLAPDVHGFVMPQSWYVDLTGVSVG
jgi:peptide/nickel transport system substrate-binding protein